MFDTNLKRIQIGKRKGVITTVVIPANVPICEFKGQVITFDKLHSLEKPDDALQVGPDIYIGPSGNITDHIRHSCNPNCMIHVAGNRSILYSIHAIRENSEITFDYSSSSTEGPDTWLMKCTCGAFNCRKEISGFYHLNENIQSEYKKSGIAALYIREPIFSRKF